MQKIYTAVILTSISRTEAFAPDNVKTRSIHGDRTMTGTAPPGNDGLKDYYNAEESEPDARQGEGAEILKMRC